MNTTLRDRRSFLQLLGGISALGVAPMTLGGCESLLERIRHRPMRP
jgi:hypothetical protein